MNKQPLNPNFSSGENDDTNLSDLRIPDLLDQQNPPQNSDDRIDLDGGNLLCLELDTVILEDGGIIENTIELNYAVLSSQPVATDTEVTDEDLTNIFVAKVLQPLTEVVSNMVRFTAFRIKIQQFYKGLEEMPLIVLEQALENYWGDPGYQANHYKGILRLNIKTDVVDPKYWNENTIEIPYPIIDKSEASNTKVKLENFLFLFNVIEITSDLHAVPMVKGKYDYGWIGHIPLISLAKAQKRLHGKEFK